MVNLIVVPIRARGKLFDITFKEGESMIEMCCRFFLVHHVDTEHVFALQNTAIKWEPMNPAPPASRNSLACTGYAVIIIKYYVSRYGITHLWSAIFRRDNLP